MLPPAPGDGKKNKKKKEASGAKTEPGLIPSLWQNLPEELVNSVLTKLPVSALKKFSRVCKRWNALIGSEEFARRCNSVQSTMFYYDNREETPYIAIPNLKTDSWEKHFVNFVSRGEYADFVVADQGLLCFRILREANENRDIILVIHNPLTRKWRRLTVPYNFQGELDGWLDPSGMLRGLIVDRETGSYKVVVAFIQEDLSVKVFIYDSSTESWKTSATVPLALDSHFRHARWSVGRSICCGGELYWVVSEMNREELLPHYKKLIKYNIELDNWAVAASQMLCEEFSTRFDLVSFENRPFMINILDSKKRSLFPSEFLSLVPAIGKFDAEDAANLLAQGDSDSITPNARITEVLAADGTWFVVTNCGRGFPDHNWYGRIYAFSKSLPTFTVFPTLDVRYSTVMGTFKPSLKSFV